MSSRQVLAVALAVLYTTVTLVLCRRPGLFGNKPVRKSHLFFFWCVMLFLDLPGLVGLQLYRLTSSSMEPALWPGDWIVGDRSEFSSLRRGDLIIFQAPNGSETLVKRLAAIPGQRIELIRGQLWLDDRRLPEPYLKEGNLDDWPALVVSKDCFIALGDNRRHSNDSRSYGEYSQKLIFGRARWRVWPPQRWGNLESL